MVDGGGLENRCTRKGTGGSNPSPSASFARSRSLNGRRETSLGIERCASRSATRRESLYKVADSRPTELPAIAAELTPEFEP